MIDNERDTDKDFSDWYMPYAMALIKFDDYEELGVILGNHIRMAWNHQQKRIDKQEERIEELEESLDGEIGYYHENMDFGTLTKLAINQDKQIEILKKALEEIEESSGNCIYNSSEDFMKGSHAAFSQQGETARTALREAFGEECET